MSVVDDPEQVVCRQYNLVLEKGGARVPSHGGMGFKLTLGSRTQELKVMSSADTQCTDFNT